MSIVVYHMQPDPGCHDLFPQMKGFTSDQLGDALKYCEHLRSLGRSHVSISVENPNSIGRPGVDCVEGGKTPDGHDYTWMKRRSM